MDDGSQLQKPRSSSLPKILLILVLIPVLVGGCVIGAVLLVSYSVWRAAELPEYVNQEAVEQQYQEEIHRITGHIDAGKPITWSQESDFGKHVLAIFKSVESEGASDDWREVYRKSEITGRSHVLLNNVGAGQLKADGADHSCVLYRYKKAPNTYVIWFRDTFEPAPEEK